MCIPACQPASALLDYGHRAPEWPCAAVPICFYHSNKRVLCVPESAILRTKRGQLSGMSENDRAAFIRHLRGALRHLYDPDALRKSALFALLRLEGQPSTAPLQRALMGAIEALKPAANTHLQSSAWRSYQALFHRYVQQFPQQEVAKSLGLSIRQLRRQENLALCLLADRLREHHHLGERSGALLSTPGEAHQEPAAMFPETNRESEAEWLEPSLPSELTTLAELVEGALETVVPLAQSMGVQMERSLAEDLRGLATQRTYLRQALLGVLTATIRAVPGGRVVLTATEQAGQASMMVQALPRERGTAGLLPAYRESLEMARQLAAHAGASLEIAGQDNLAQPLTARIVLHVTEELPVLVIDDNADTLQLFQRYCAHTRYRVAGTREPLQAEELAEKLGCRMIVLDVMLPGLDGWELLGRLRVGPATCHIPVLVCTILPEEELALSLGAAGFLKKPVGRQAFLAALERLAADQRPVSGR